MKVICAWCKKPMGEKTPYDNNSITHGMCKKCYKKERAKLKDKD